MKKLSVFLLFLFFSLLLFAQDLEYAKISIDYLCSPELAGRGYVNAGDRKAAYYIEKELRIHKCKAFDSIILQAGENKGQKTGKYTQEFPVRINTYPEIVSLKINDKIELVPGVDYIIKPTSKEVKVSKFSLRYLTIKDIKKQKDFEKFLYTDFTQMAVVIDMEQFRAFAGTDNFKAVLNNEIKADVIILLETQPLTWGVAGSYDKFPTVIVAKSKWPSDVQTVSLQIDRKFTFNYETQNVIGFHKGTKYPDSFIVIGAHYDHLGMMGKKCIFPGANDNAAGVAMLLDLARFYKEKENRPEYTLVFIGFGAEELGLQGSTYFTEHPLFPLKNIKFMINLDLLGSGEAGMMVVNGSVHTKDYDIIKGINDAKQYLPALNSRGSAAISDHYSFEIKGVKAFYFYLMGADGKDYFYHQPGDVPSNLSLAGYEGAFKLITEFISKMK